MSRQLGKTCESGRLRSDLYLRIQNAFDPKIVVLKSLLESGWITVRKLRQIIDVELWRRMRKKRVVQRCRIVQARPGHGNNVKVIRYIPRCVPCFLVNQRIRINIRALPIVASRTPR